MLHILFLILKIIGIILLVILGILLTLVGVVLFVPIRYCLKTETTNGMKGLRTEAKATWLYRLVSAHVTYREETLDWQVRVGWKKFRSHEEIFDEEKYTSEEKSSGEQRNSDEERISGEEKSSHRESVHEEESGTQSTNWIEKIKCTIKEICDKIRNIKEFLMEETHINAFLRIKKEIVFFIKKIKPDQIKGYIRFGLEEPYDTGRVLAGLSMLYPFYGEHIQIYPEFERTIIEADVFFKGRIHLMHLLAVVCRVYLDKNIKKAYKNYKESKG